MLSATTVISNVNRLLFNFYLPSAMSVYYQVPTAKLRGKVEEILRDILKISKERRRGHIHEVIAVQLEDQDGILIRKSLMMKSGSYTTYLFNGIFNRILI